MFEFQEALSFDDVLLVPKHSKVGSRSKVSLRTEIASLMLTHPIISANMATVTEGDMAYEMAINGGLGVVHRMQSIQQQAEIIEATRTRLGKDINEFPIGFAFGLRDWEERITKCLLYGANIAFLDIAHADQESVLQFIRDWYSDFHNIIVPLIVGNIATSTAALNILECVPKEAYPNFGLKIGIGGGSMCTTRIQTGVGIPTFHSVYSIANSVSDIDNITLIADGGIKNSGDIVKALAAGADAVMCGSLLAGAKEAPGSVIKDREGRRFKIYRGSASYADKRDYSGEPTFIEGEETLVPFRGPVKDIISRLNEGVRSGFSYLGASNLFELQVKAEFRRITQSGLRESHAHGLTIS